MDKDDSRTTENDARALLSLVDEDAADIPSFDITSPAGRFKYKKRKTPDTDGYGSLSFDLRLESIEYFRSKVSIWNSTC